MQQAQRFPIPRQDEERALAERWQAKEDLEAAERLLGSHLRLVIKIARAFQGYGLPLDELIAEGSEFAWRRSLLAEGMSKLTNRERHILSERRLGDDPKTLNDLSRIHGVSRERIRQIEVRAFEKVQAVTLQAAAYRAKRTPRLQTEHG